jgi:hypothetical protein
MSRKQMFFSTAAGKEESFRKQENNYRQRGGPKLTGVTELQFSSEFSLEEITLPEQPSSNVS